MVRVTRSKTVAMAVAAALVSAGLVGSSYGAPPTIYNLGTLNDGGGMNSYGNDINASGHVTGHSYFAVGSGTHHAYKYTGTPGVDGEMIDLGTLGGTNSRAGGINDSGQVSGHSDRADGSFHAFRYDGTPGAGGIMHDLDTLGGSTSVGTRINASGQVTGYSVLPGTLTPPIHAFRYDGTPGVDGVMHDLGALGGAFSRGLDINDAGQVTGWAFKSDFTQRAFRYDGTPDAGGVMRDLGSLGNAQTQSHGNAINTSGQVVGTSYLAGNSGPRHAFFHTGTPSIDGVMHDLGTLGTGTVSIANAINTAGVIGGESAIDPGPNSTFHAFLYVGTPGVDGDMIDLDAWLDAVNPAEGAKWILRNVHSISDDGLVTGYGNYTDGPGGLYDGGQFAYILDVGTLVPEPAGLSLLAVAGLPMLRRRRRG